LKTTLRILLPSALCLTTVYGDIRTEKYPWWLGQTPATTKSQTPVPIENSTQATFKKLKQPVTHTKTPRHQEENFVPTSIIFDTDEINLDESEAKDVAADDLNMPMEASDITSENDAQEEHGDDVVEMPEDEVVEMPEDEVVEMPEDEVVEMPEDEVVEMPESEPEDDVVKMAETDLDQKAEQWENPLNKTKNWFLSRFSWKNKEASKLEPSSGGEKLSRRGTVFYVIHAPNPNSRRAAK
jgi:hypothetical protein